MSPVIRMSMLVAVLVSTASDRRTDFGCVCVMRATPGKRVRQHNCRQQ